MQLWAIACLNCEKQRFLVLVKLFSRPDWTLRGMSLQYFFVASEGLGGKMVSILTTGFRLPYSCAILDL